MVVSTALMCLALNIYHEARGEPVAGQHAVAHVTLNRADTNDRVCHEVFRHRQFSWTNGVRKTSAGWQIPPHLIPKQKKPVDALSWLTSKEVAQKALEGKSRDVTGGARFYHANYVKPRWSRGVKPSVKVGNHIFYVQVK